MARQLTLWAPKPFKPGEGDEDAGPHYGPDGKTELGRCYFCGQPERIELDEYWPATREFQFTACCQDGYDAWVEQMREWTPDNWATFFRVKAGVHVRGVGGDVAKREALGIHPGDTFTVDAGITIIPSGSLRDRAAGKSSRGALSRAEIKQYIREHHAHAPDPPAGFLWGYAIFNGAPSDPIYDEKGPRISGKANERPVGLKRWPETLIGVAMIGRPTAQATEVAARERGVRICEVSRVALNHRLPSFLTYKASSEVYEAAFLRACHEGYQKIQTFTLASETAMSLRYARWKRVGESAGGQTRRPGRRVRSAELAQPKVRWERRCK